MSLKAKWIWGSSIADKENTAVCFRRNFNVDKNKDAILKISADTRYVLYINGKEIGRGPIRSTIDRWFYDEYDISSDIVSGENLLAVRVWDYGMSTYQTIANRGGLTFSFTNDGVTICESDESCLCSRDFGLVSKTVKRNVNLGFMEYYDADKFSFDWMNPGCDDSKWETAVLITDNWGELTKRPVKYMDKKPVRAETVYSINETKPKRQVVSINTRNTLYPGRRDANATIMTSYIGAIIKSSEDCTGIINFPTNKWNGMHGDYKIDGLLYEIGKGDREKEVSLKKGEQLFLMKLSAKFDDLFVHIEYEFDSNIEFRDFFTVGPVMDTPNNTDGFSKIYGGLVDYDGYGTAPESKDDVFDMEDLDSLKNCGFPFKIVDNDYIFNNDYIYSLVKNIKITKNIPIKSHHNGLLHGNNNITRLELPEEDSDVTMILDFNDMYVGNLEFCLNASLGTVVDIYCYENMYGGEIDYTFGLNNGIRYVCKDGWQQYSTMTRIGLRYMMLTFRNMTKPVDIKEVIVHQTSYPVSRNGNFRCSDWQLNKIFEISRRTNLMCTEDTFADSPTYEQAYWSGDAQVSAAVSAFYFGEYELLKHCINQVPLGRKYTELLPALMPTDWETAIPVWTMNWMISIEQYMYYTGDRAAGWELYDEIKKTLEYYTKFIEEDGAFYISAWNMIDWASMDITNEGVVTVQQGLLAHCFTFAAKIAATLGFEEDEVYFTEKSELLLNYLEQKLWMPEKNAYVDGWSKENGYSKTISVQTHTILELYGLIRNEDRRNLVLEKLLGDSSNWLQPGSPFMLFYLFEIRHSYGFDQNIINDIRERWGMMLRYDSSTCWEVFPGFYENARTRSYCHSWSSAPGYIFIKYLLGLTPSSTGFEDMTLKIPETDLQWCEGSIPTPFGKIDVWWSVENEVKQFRAVVPEEIRITDCTDGSWAITIERI